MSEKVYDQDLKIARFLDHLPRDLTLQEIGIRIDCVFGTMAWSLKRVQSYLGIAPTESRTGRRPVLDTDRDLQKFFQAHRQTLSLDDMLAAARKEYPEKRLPSRSALHRFLQGTRRR